MCGFSGEITFDGESASVDRVRRMTDALAARGPDASGLFAFAIAERDSGRVVLARDRLGIKPLYLASEGSTRLRFASSLPAAGPSRQRH